MPARGWYISGRDITVHMSYSDLVKMYEDRLLDKGWALWPEDVVRIWRKRTQMGLFSWHILAFSRESMTNPQGEYKLPDSFLREVAKYPTAYVVSLTYMDNIHAKRCLGK